MIKVGCSFNSVSAGDIILRQCSRFCFTVGHVIFPTIRCLMGIVTGVKKSLVLVPGTSWISGRTSIYFHSMSAGQVKNSMLVYFSLTRTSYLVTGQVKILMDLPGGQVKILTFFYPCQHRDRMNVTNVSSEWVNHVLSNSDDSPCIRGPNYCFHSAATLSCQK